MSVYAFKVTITGEGSLWGVEFYPEGKNSIGIPFSTTIERKVFVSNPFSISVEGDFDYLLKVGAVYGTEFSLKIEIRNGDSWTELKLQNSKGETGKGCKESRQKPNIGCLSGSVKVPDLTNLKKDLII